MSNRMKLTNMWMEKIVLFLFVHLFGKIIQRWVILLKILCRHYSAPVGVPNMRYNMMHTLFGDETKAQKKKQTREKSRCGILDISSFSRWVEVWCKRVCTDFSFFFCSSVIYYTSPHWSWCLMWIFHANQTRTVNETLLLSYSFRFAAEIHQMFFFLIFFLSVFSTYYSYIMTKEELFLTDNEIIKVE